MCFASGCQFVRISCRRESGVPSFHAFACLLGMRAQSPLLLFYPWFPSLPSFSPVNSLLFFLFLSCMPRVLCSPHSECQCMHVCLLVFSIRDNYLHTKHSSAAPAARVSNSFPGVTTKGKREPVLRYAVLLLCTRD